MQQSAPAEPTAEPARRAWTFRVVLAVAVAAVVVAPVLRFRAAAGDRYDGLMFLGASDAEFYVAMLRRVAEGSYGSANDLLHEWRGVAGTGGEWLALRLLAAPFRVLGGDLHTYVVAATAVCAAIQFVLFAEIARALRLREAAALATGLVCCLVPFVWSFDGAQLWLGRPSLVPFDFLPLYRPVNPSVTSICLWTALLAAQRLLGGATWTWTAVLALCTGLSWSLYAPLFPLVGGIAAAAAIACWFRDDRRPAYALAAACVAIAAWRATSVAARMGGDPDTEDMLRGNLLAVPSFAPILTANVVTLLAVAVVAVACDAHRSLTAPALFVAIVPALLLLLVFNQQIVTGRLYQPFHYDWFYAPAFLWMALAALAPRLREPLERIATLVSGASAWRRTRIGFAVAAALVIVIAFGGPLTAPLLRTLHLIRGDAVARPVLAAALGVGVLGAVFASVAALRAGALRGLATTACVAAGAAALVNGWAIQEEGLAGRVVQHVLWQRSAPALRWIGEHARADDVVLAADGAVARLVASYTGRDLLIASEVQFFADKPPEDEWRRRWLVLLVTFGIDRARLEHELRDGGLWHYEMFKWRAFGPLTGRVRLLAPNAKPEPLVSRDMDDVLAEFDRVRAMPARERLRLYRVDWVLWDDTMRAAGLADPGASAELTEVLAGDGVRLYRVDVGR